MNNFANSPRESTAAACRTFCAIISLARLASAGYRPLLHFLILFVAVGTAPATRAEETEADSTEIEAPRYPIAVAVDGDALYVVDLELPGVWKVVADQREVFVRGSKRLHTPLSRPRCVTMHPQGGILVGDSSTREVYHIAEGNAEPKPLSDGNIGIAMALAVSPDGNVLYVGDAEQRSVVRMPLSGGEPELVVPVDARGLAFDSDGVLWAVTPDAAAIHRIDVGAKTHLPVITGRPYRYPNGLAWAGEYGLVTDGYSKSIWKFTADGKTEPWFEGAPLAGPVGITAAENSVWVADPKMLKVFQFDKQSKDVKTRL